MNDKYKVLALVGSLRAGSYNKMLLNAAIELAPANMEFETFDIKDIPLYNNDEMLRQIPDSVAELKRKVLESDALLIVTPEYNHSVPGVLKNAIDWASRPIETYPFTGKPLGIMGASTGIAGSLRSQLHLRQILFTANDMRTPEIIVQFVSGKFDAEGKLIDEQLREHLVKFMAAFDKWITKIKKIS